MSSNSHKNYSPTQSMVNPGMNYWVRSTSPTQSTRRNAAGRGLFSGLQDTKHYNVEGGWAGRQVVDDGNSSLLGWVSREQESVRPTSAIYDRSCVEENYVVSWSDGGPSVGNESDIELEMASYRG